MIWGKRRKEERAKELALFERNEFLRKEKYNNWTFDIIRGFMFNRAKMLFDKDFIIDESNEPVFDLLCWYFMGSETFCKEANKLEVQNPSLDKGICLAGNFGTGKTWLFRIFQKNKRQTYYVRSAKDVAQEYLNSSDKKIPEEYLVPFKNPINDAAVFCQAVSGLCIDDLGAENVKNNFGNVVNVIGDLIEHRYAKGFTGIFLHASTNLSSEELKKFYGERVTSRMREIFNFIELPGNDRRK